jgi:prevent-host-death family protein
MDNQPRSPARTISAVKAREKFGQLLDEVYYKGDLVIIERDGRPMAAVIPLSLLDKWQKQHDQTKKSAETIKGITRKSHKGRT